MLDDAGVGAGVEFAGFDENPKLNLGAPEVFAFELAVVELLLGGIVGAVPLPLLAAAPKLGVLGFPNERVGKEPAEAVEG